MAEEPCLARGGLPSVDTAARNTSGSFSSDANQSSRRKACNECKQQKVLPRAHFYLLQPLMRR